MKEVNRFVVEINSATRWGLNEVVLADAEDGRRDLESPYRPKWRQRMPEYAQRTHLSRNDRRRTTTHRGIDQ